MRKTIGNIRLSDLLLAVVTVIIVFSILGFIVIKSEAADKSYVKAIDFCPITDGVACP